MYKLTKSGIQNLETTEFIENMNSRQGRKYQKWLSGGNTPEPEFTKVELAAKKESDIKRKEGELIQVQIQFDMATAKNFSIAEDYGKQLTKLELELSKFKK